MHSFPVWIVEDEPLSARYIKMLVLEFPEFASCVIFENAEAALDEFQRSKPDLLITDIKLIGMSGLELLKEIRKTDDSLLAIIISGYRLFEFAKEAITLSIMDYLLKPIDRQKLKALLSEALDRLMEQERTSQQETLTAMLEGTPRRAKPLAGFPYSEAQMVMVSRQGDFPSILEQYNRKLLQIDRQRLVLVPYQTNSLVVIEGMDDKPSHPLSQRIVDNFTYDQGRQISNQVIVTSGRPYPITMLKEMVEKLYTIAQSNLSFGPTQIVSLEQMPQAEPQNLTESKTFSALLSHIYPKDWEEVYRGLAALGEEWEKNRTPLYIVKNQTLMIIDKLQRLYPAALASSLLYEQAGDVVASCSSYGELGEQLKRFFEETICHVTENSGNEATYDLFVRVTDYLHRDVRVNYTLSEVAEHFGISQPYLSKLFRIYAGQTFKEYLLSYKIETAVAIMKANPSTLIKEVATAVGFEPLYFSTVFFRIIGQYPTQFVKNLHQESRRSTLYD